MQKNEDQSRKGIQPGAKTALSGSLEKIKIRHRGIFRIIFIIWILILYRMD